MVVAPGTSRTGTPGSQRLSSTERANPLERRGRKAMGLPVARLWSPSYRRDGL